MRRRHHHERGAAVVETAFLLPLILMLAVGMAEIGFAMISQLTGANAVREGARVAAAGRDNASVELAIIRSVEQAMCSLERGELLTLEIFKADAGGEPYNAATHLNEYTPSGDLVCDSSTATALACTNGCPWPPSLRSDSVTSLDDIGVRVTYTHEWVSSFVFRTPQTWTDTTVMRIEPDTGD
jgi:hypothetical protein